MTLLVVLGAWFATGVLATLVLGPRLRRAAEQVGAPLEPEPVYLADRSPLRWRLGTLAVVGLLAGSTGMAAAGALPGSAQSIAHRVLGSVGVHVPESPDAPAAVATGPAPTPWADAGPRPSSPGPDTADQPSDPSGSPPADEDPGLTAPGGAGTGDALTAPTPSASGGSESPATTAPAPLRPEGSDVPDGSAPVEEPSDVPADPPVEETPSTTTPPGELQPPAEQPPDPSGDPSTTTTTSTSTTLPAPPPPADPAG